MWFQLTQAEVSIARPPFLHMYGMSLQNNPYLFPFVLTSSGAAATLAIKQLIYLTWKLMITNDSSSGDNKGRGNPEKIELDWSSSEWTNGPVTEGNSYTSSSIAPSSKPRVLFNVT